MDRREFLSGTMGAALLAGLPRKTAFQAGAARAGGAWDAGRVRHLLATVSESRILLKASFLKPLTAAPTLRVGTTAATGRRNDSSGECWQFYAEGLQPGRRYTLSLSAGSSALCEPWPLSTFPAPDARPDRFRVLFFTCAGGPESDSLTRGNLPTAVRNRLLRRALSFQPDAAVANGDHIYWDLHSQRGPQLGTSNDRLRRFDPASPVFGGANETELKRVAAPQIVPVYGTDFRSTPVFFLQDDHDHFDNDEGTDEIVTFPAPWFQIQLARATQQMYYPEFLIDPTRPASLPWSAMTDRGPLSESFGTLRYGRLAEVLLYDVRRTMTLAGPSAVLVDREVEKWLLARTASADVTHLVHAPSNPPGWSAGKWGEWYPDVLGPDDKLTTKIPKPYWQRGWLAQHDRLLTAIGSMKRSPLVISGDLHAIAIGQMLRAGESSFTNPVTAVLAGPIGTATTGWPSVVRGVGASPPGHLEMREAVKPIEEHGFTLVDFLPDRISIRLFRWNVRTESPDAIDRLEPFYSTELGR